MFRFARISLSCLPLLTLLITGCGVDLRQQASTTGAALQGRIQGGQHPVSGANVYLFAANTTGYGAASVSLVGSSGANVFLDTSGGPTSGDYYVTTDGNGSFTIAPDYTCTPGSQVYIYAFGGNPGSGVNSASAMMAVLGTCPTAGNFTTAVPYIFVNEVTTVAAAYTMSGFATDPTHVSSSGSAQAKLGIANAFALAANLVNPGTGVALATTPAGNGTVQQAQLNALANILVSCVNSTGPTSANCKTLFQNSLAGGLTGAQPTDTATAAINIAHWPGVSVAQRYTLANPQVAFSPSLSSAPNDWYLSIRYTGGGTNDPYDLAIDGSGNVWLANANNNSISEYSPLGVALSPTAGFVGSGLSQPHHLAIDPLNNVWVSNSGKNTVGYYAMSEFSNSGSALSNSGYVCNTTNACEQITFDTSGNLWTPSDYGMTEITPAGSVKYPSNASLYNAIAADGQGHLWFVGIGATVNGGSVPGLFEWATPGTGAIAGPFPNNSMYEPTSAAIDATGNIWIADLNQNISVFNSSGAALSFSPAAVAYSGVNNLQSLAVDGANSVWFSNTGNTTIGRVYTSNGSLYPGSPTNNDIGPYAAGIGIDPSGNVWNGTAFYNGVVELIGAGAPTVTPVSLAVKNNTIGTLP